MYHITLYSINTNILLKKVKLNLLLISIVQNKNSAKEKLTKS